MNRREFVKKGVATTAYGYGCLRLGLKEALAIAAATGKPLLTQNSLNAFIAANPLQRRALAAQAKHDMKGFLHQHFTLAAGQERQLNAIPASEFTKINQAIDAALQKNARFVVNMVNPLPRKPGQKIAFALPEPKIDWSFKVSADSTGKKTGEVSVTVHK